MNQDGSVSGWYGFAGLLLVIGIVGSLLLLFGYMMLQLMLQDKYK